MTNWTGPALFLAIGTALVVGVPSLAQQPAQTAQDIVTSQVALELGRLMIENRTLNVSVDVLRGRIAELDKQLKEAQAKCGPPPE